MQRSALLCFGVCLTRHIFTGVQHWCCCYAAPYFSKHTYDIPLRDAFWVIFWVRGTLCCTLKGGMHSIGRLPPYWDITKSPIGRSTALTSIGRSFEIGRSKSRCTIPPYIAPPDCTGNRKDIYSGFRLKIDRTRTNSSHWSPKW